ncbi:hypothetical protein EV174_005379, partial [Coemansia sp. RSA 2320]
MNREYFNHRASPVDGSLELRDHAANAQPVPGLPRNHGGNYATSGYPPTSGGLTGGSLRSTRSTQAGTAYARPQGSLRRNGYHHEAATRPTAFDEARYNAPNLQPYVPDASERRGTPEYFGAGNGNATQTIDYSYRRNHHQPQQQEQEQRRQQPLTPIKTSAANGYHMPATHSTSAQRFSGDSGDEATSSPSSGDFSRHATVLSGNARLVASSARMSSELTEKHGMSSQRAEFGYSSPAKESFSPSPERDEIADIIADMSKTRISPSDDSDGLFISRNTSSTRVYLQLGDCTKRVALTERPTQTALINLFIETYQGRLAEDPESLPTIYINDAKRQDLFYELEDMSDVVDGAVLSWRTQPLSSRSNDPVKAQDDGSKGADVRAEVCELAAIVRTLAETVAQIPAQMRSELANAVDK